MLKREISAESNCLVLDYSGDKGEIVLSKCFSREIVPNCPANILTFSDSQRQLCHRQKYFSQKIFLTFYFQLRLDFRTGESSRESSLVGMKYWSESPSKKLDLSEFYLLVPRGLWYNLTALLTPWLGTGKTEVRLWSIRRVTTSLSGITRDTETLPGFVVTQVRAAELEHRGKIATKTSPAKLSIREMRHFWSAGAAENIPD